MNRGWLITIPLLFASAAGAGEHSTVHEWVNRFVPEQEPKIELPAYADALDRARAEVNAGKYRAALSTLATVKSGNASERMLLRARALIGLGETSAAANILTTAPLSTLPAAWQLRIDLMLESYDLAEAPPLIEAWLAAEPESIAARLRAGQILEAQGNFPAAIEAYSWFTAPERTFIGKWNNDPDQFENPDDLTDVATAISRWASLTLAFRDQPSLNDTVLNMYLRAFDVIDREHLRSRFLAASFAMSRGNAGAAQKHLKPALERAPYNREGLIQLGRSAIESGNDGAIHQAIESLRQSDPDSFDATFFRAWLDARTSQWASADVLSARLIEKSPKRPEAIGLRAAILAITGNETGCDQLLASADSANPRTSDVSLIAATILKHADQIDRAERLLKLAIERSPWLTEARHELGDMYLNDSQDSNAREVLDEAYKFDPYNVGTVNRLRLLDELAKYQKFETAHLIVYFDADADPIVADTIAPFMERTFADLAHIFQYTPERKVVIQVYPNDDEFSVRMAGIPGIENYGVSFGRVLATVAPRRGTNKGNFNWARVLRHELVHTFNLLQTKHRVPRWLTEGLAVWQEGVPFRFKEVPEELYKRTMEDRLFTVRTFAQAFISPKSGSDGEQAYTQGAWFARYLEETYGRASIVRLLQAYGNAKADEDAFLAATGKPLKQVETAWHAWMKTRLKPWGFDEESSSKSEALINEGELAIKSKLYEQAIKLYEEAYRLQPTEIKPHQRLAGLYLQKTTANPTLAIEHLKPLHILELQNNRFAKQIARLYMQENDLENALVWANEAAYVDLYDASAYELMAQIEQKLNRTDAAEKSQQLADRIKLWEAKRSQPKPGKTEQP